MQNNIQAITKGVIFVTSLTIKHNVMELVKTNLNHTVHAIVADWAIERHLMESKLGSTYTIEDFKNDNKSHIQGHLRFQLHELMSSFGKYLTVGLAPAINPNIVIECF